MSDSHQTDERGPNATVRKMATENLVVADDTPIYGGRGVLGLPFVAELRRRELETSTPPSHVMRHAVIGAGVGLTIVCGGFVAIAAQAALVAPAAAPPTEVLHALIEGTAKADRLALVAPVRPGLETAVNLIDGVAVATLVEPVATAGDKPLTYASLEAPTFATAAIDRALEVPPIAGSPRGPNVTDSEEPDDEAVMPLVLPMPRSRPVIAPLVLPMPQPRPHFVALTPPGIEEETRAAEPARTAPQPPSNALGFFSSPTEPVKAPTKTTIDTPFGVPYVLQTGSVDTTCLKPELLDILRKIEGHYRQKVVITSGFRDRGRQGSLHRQCAAVDIEVPGVDAASLATYARTIPNIGGVGTYCYPRLIHVDIGTPRDWKYGCGSYFAMRGGPGSWGKVPGNLAKVQTDTASATNANSEDD